MAHASRCLVFVGLCLALAAGCGRRAALLPLVKVGGTVTLDGKPFERATLCFYPAKEKAGKDVARGYTDEEGAFAVVYHNGQEGLLPGDYRVVFSLKLLDDGSFAPPDALPATVHEALPPYLSDPKTGGIHVSIPPEGGILNLTIPSPKTGK